MAARALSLVLFLVCLKSLALEGIGQYLTFLSGEVKPEKVIKGPIPERYFERYTLGKRIVWKRITQGEKREILQRSDKKIDLKSPPLKRYLWWCNLEKILMNQWTWTICHGDDHSACKKVPLSGLGPNWDKVRKMCLKNITHCFEKRPSPSQRHKKLDQVYCAWLIKWVVKRQRQNIQLAELNMRWWIISETWGYWVSIWRYWLVLGWYKLVLLGIGLYLSRKPTF